ncbi:hypothetical protein TVAG_441530 [Trichomonas vaginalis G3]|uniref:Uncharacterized protein n=1 Tax=Trichomonas vaginalis (strain ATCC PRA-98 / G3) TaxID=412133 RepID=A2FL78_TRIV3|nr:hypothetical protein TVAGG3_0569560 [Trichomonas vaginalis G3]EAX94334.1 hypothetical protein TVAG_441530 [Trichomonas vaginalis G3]KAI5521817.1 hypothetical protein TVAGG3_0569560 [Trichomonas vaginalis G3]|eukprot:XP_001307264.1 hypothetical protein [Trichomonas vaginalis G3]
MTETPLPVKRPSSGKTVSYFLQHDYGHEITKKYQNQKQNFQEIRHLYELILKSSDKKITPEHKQKLLDTIDILQTIKSQLIEGFSHYEKNSHKESLPPAHPHRQQPRMEILRSVSQKITYNPQTHQKPQKKLKRASITTETTSRQINSMTIWNQVNRFYSTVPTVSNLANFLYPIDITPKRGQIGQHYSIAYNDKLKQKYKNDSVQIRIPGSITPANANSGASPEVVFHRLLCSFVQLTKERPVERNGKNFEAPPIDHNAEALFPNAYGTSIYTSIPFEQKLLLEVQSLDLHPGKNEIISVDNDIAREIDLANEEYINSLKKTNQMRASILERLKAAEPSLVAKAMKLRKAVSQPDRPETPKKIPRPKSRGKSFDE